MEIRQMLLPEFEAEMKKTRTMLERVPEGQQEYTPHEKSMHLGKLAAHIARLPEFGSMILETPGFDMSAGKMPPLVMESRQQILDSFDAAAEKVRKAISATDEAAWQQKWKFSFQDKTILDEPRFVAFRAMFLSHLIHHRAQLGVYLRLKDVPLPATYGPSADDRMGF